LWEGDFSTFRTCGACMAMVREIGLECYCHGLLMDEVDARDYPEVKSVAEFHQRRDQNWDRLYRKVTA